MGYQLWVGVALGSMVLLMIHHLAGGGWGFVIRRLAESAARTLPYLAILFLPLVAGMGQLYPWSHEEEVLSNELLRHKSPYLNVPFFLLRTAFYFAVWIALAALLSRWSREQDQGKRAFVNRLQAASGLGLLLYGLTGTFAGVDWLMSLEPEWFSMVYGLLFIVGQIVGALAFAILALSWLASRPPLSLVVSPGHFHDLGNLLLAFVMLWAYLGFSQYLIIWSANLPEETPWILNRTKGGWQWVGLGLVVTHFAVPFALLLQRSFKRRAEVLVWIAGAILVMRVVDLLWLIAPAFSPSFALNVLDLAAPIGVGGIWIFLFTRELRARPLLPQGDPRFVNLLQGVEHGRS
jgi:hypothetical protein